MSKLNTMPRITPADIKRMRENTGLSQDGFATGAGIPRSSLSRLERGEGNLSEESEAKVLQFIEKHDTGETEKNESPAETNGNSESDTPIENVIDNSLVEATVNQIIEAYLENLEQTVEAHVKTVSLSASMLFKSDCTTISEMEEILETAETKLAGEVSFTLRDRLEGIKIAGN